MTICFKDPGLAAAKAKYLYRAAEKVRELFLSSAATLGRPLVDVWLVKILPESMKAGMDLQDMCQMYVQQVKIG